METTINGIGEPQSEYDWLDELLNGTPCQVSSPITDVDINQAFGTTCQTLLPVAGDNHWHDQWNPRPILEQEQEGKKFEKEVFPDVESPGRGQLLMYDPKQKSLPEFTGESKEENRRKKNRISAKASRERKKEILLNDKKKFTFFTKKNKELTEYNKKLRIKLNNLSLVGKHIIHQESCLADQTVDIHLPLPLKTGLMEESAERSLEQIGINYISIDQVQVIKNNHQQVMKQQEQHTISQEVGMKIANLNPKFVSFGNDICFPNDNRSSFDHCSESQQIFDYQSNSVNFNVSNNFSSLAAKQNGTAQPIASNWDRFSQGVGSSSQNNNSNLPFAKNVTSSTSPWCVETNQDGKTEEELSDFLIFELNTIGLGKANF